MSKHRGEILKEVFERQGVTISKVAKKVGVDRATVYRHFLDEDLSIDYIVKYGQAIDFDFSKYFPELLQVVQEPGNQYETRAPKTYGELERDVEYWKDKYIDLLEQYNKLIRDKLFEKQKS